MAPDAGDRFDLLADAVVVRRIAVAFKVVGNEEYQGIHLSIGNPGLGRILRFGRAGGADCEKDSMRQPLCLAPRPRPAPIYGTWIHFSGLLPRG